MYKEKSKLRDREEKQASMVHVKSFVFNPVGENTYVIYDDSKQAAIVDCGCSNESERRVLLDFIQKEGLTPVLLLATHLHFDHAFGNAWALRQWSGMEVYVHPKDLTDQPLPSEQCALFGLNVAYEDVPRERYKYLEHGMVLTFGDTALQVLYVPGHSPGHVVFYCREASFLISGDTLFFEEIGRTDLWGGNYHQLVEGIRKHILTLPAETLVYTGHGDGTSVGHEQRHNPYCRIH